MIRFIVVAVVVLIIIATTCGTNTNNNTPFFIHAFLLSSPSSSSPPPPFGTRRRRTKKSTTSTTTTTTSSILGMLRQEQNSKENSNNNKKKKKEFEWNKTVDGPILPRDYFQSVYEEEEDDGNTNNSNNNNNHSSTKNTTTTTNTPWNIGGPQPAIVQAYRDGKLRGRILDAGCGAGENCIFLAQKYGITSIVGCDIAPGAIRMAKKEESKRRIIMEQEEEEKESSSLSSFWTRPEFFVASCTEMAKKYHQEKCNHHHHHDTTTNNNNKKKNDLLLFDVSIDSGLLHCLSDEDAQSYVENLSQLVKPDTGRVYVGCFSTQNPSESWTNPRRLSRDYLQQLFCFENGFEIISIQDIWWSRPPQRGSKQGGAFSMALWMEARRLSL